jgi:hypothetical protein
LFQGSSRALKVVPLFRVPGVFQWIHGDWTHEPYSGFPVQQGHILSIGGDDLSDFVFSQVVKTMVYNVPYFLS